MASTVQRLSRLSAEEQVEFRHMMAALKGLTAFQAALVFGRLTPSTDWRKCTKGLMCEEWARRNHIFGRKDLAAVKPERLAKAISEVKDKYGIK